MKGLVLVMSNLKKRKLAGFESNGMVYILLFYLYIYLKNSKTISKKINFLKKLIKLIFQYFLNSIK